MIRWKRHRQPR